jgi:Sporulation and spore germination
MFRVRALLAMLVLLVASTMAAGCARTDQPGAAGPGDTTVTIPPPASATPSPPAPTSTIPRAPAGPLLVWPFRTSVAVTHPVAVPPVPVLEHVRVGRHPGYDRIVFQFAGPLPSYRVRPVTSLAEDASGAPVWPGSPNLLQIRLDPAQAHTDDGQTPLTATELQTFPNLPVLRSYRLIGDFEGVVSYGLRLGLRRPNLRLTELTNPNRLVIDLAHQHLARVRVWFLHRPNYTAGRQPELVTVLRAITPARVGQGALDAIFAGPTSAEQARGLATVRSGATGATLVRISDGVAHVRLQGTPASHGATVTVASLIMPTLKQFPTVDYVKIYDPSGRTQQPGGRRDSIPASLEP